MKKYVLKEHIEVQQYKKGMEDGWRVYYWYENHNETPLSESKVTFKNIKDLEIWKDKMEKYSDPKNMIYFEEIVPVVETVNGLIEIISGKEYLAIDSSGNKIVFAKEVFESLFQEVKEENIEEGK